MIVEDFTMIIPKDMKWKDHVFLKSAERKHEYKHAWINNLVGMDTLIYSRCVLFKGAMPRNHLAFCAATTFKSNGKSRDHEPFLPFFINEMVDAWDAISGFCAGMVHWFDCGIALIGNIFKTIFYKHFRLYDDIAEARLEGLKYMDNRSKALHGFLEKHENEYKVLEFTTENKQQGCYGVKK